MNSLLVLLAISTTNLRPIDVAYLVNEKDAAAIVELTDREYAIRQKRCGSQPVSCDMPETKPARSYPPQAVVRPALELPGELPVGMSATLGRCGGDWIGVAAATVDTAGRVQIVDLARMSRTTCLRQIETMLRLSYATNTSVMSPLAMADVVLAHAGRDALCLDEDPPSDEPVQSLSRTGGDVVAPVKIHSIDPYFPESIRRTMKADSASIVILEAVITKQGCVRSIRPVAQSPFAELNSAAVYAMSQWKFSPGMLNGKPVDVIYNLTIKFQLGR